VLNKADYSVLVYEIVASRNYLFTNNEIRSLLADAVNPTSVYLATTREVFLLSQTGMNVNSLRQKLLYSAFLIAINTIAT